MTVVSHHQGTPSRNEVLEKITYAQKVMAETSLNPVTREPVRIWPFKTTQIRPARYRGRKKPPMIYNRKQGWETATPQGEKLDAAIQDVGAAIEQRAMSLLGPTQPLTLAAITATQVRIGALNPTELANALSLSGTAPAEFESESAYEESVANAKTYAEACLVRRNQTPSDTGTAPAGPTAAVLKGFIEILITELDGFTPGSGSPSAWTMNELTPVVNARLAALREVREMGGIAFGPNIRQGQGLMDQSSNQADNVRAVQSVRYTSGLLPSDWVEEANKAPLDVYAGSGGSVRGAAEKAQDGQEAKPPYIKISTTKWYPAQGPMDKWQAAALHEMGHHFEAVYPEVNQIARTHKAIRSVDADGVLEPLEEGPHSEENRATCVPIKMKYLNEGDYWYRPSVFPNIHACLELSPRASEVFSTGIASTLAARQGALSGHGGHEPDPRHLHLTLGILATVGRR